MGRIRWPGLAAFAAFVALLGLAWWLLVDFVAERAIERTGTALVGARVDLDSADVSLWPAGIELRRLQVTDPARPMTNAVEIERIAGLIDGLEALRRKLIVDELAVEGVQFGTQRERSGAVRDEAPAAAEEGAGFELPSLSLPDPEQILAEENLESVALIRGLRSDIEGSRERWKRQLAELPGEEELERYRKRIEEIRELRGVESVARAARLADDIRRDLSALREAASEFEGELEALQERLREARRAPARDVARLRERYGLSDAGIANIGGRLLGARVRSHIARALGWYRRLEPFLARAGGSVGGGPEVVERLRGRSVRVRFREEHPLPDFLVRHADVSIELQAGNFSGTIDNITPDQPILGAPMTLAFAAEKSRGVGSIHVEGELDHVRPDRPADRLAVAVRGFEVKDLGLSESPDWAVLVRRGSVDLGGRASVEGENVHGKFELALANAELETGFSASNTIAGGLARALRDISAFTLSAEVSGTIDAYEVKLRTDLDRLLGSAVGSLARNQADRFQAQLTEAIEARLAGPLADLDGSFGGLGALGEDFAERLEAGSGLLGEVQAAGAGPVKGFELPGPLRFP